MGRKGPVFVGRTGVTAALRTEWDEVVRGASRVVWIDGDPGIGKTAVVRAFVDTLDPGQVSLVSTDPDETGRPFGVFDRLLELLPRSRRSSRMATRPAGDAPRTPPGSDADSSPGDGTESGRDVDPGTAMLDVLTGSPVASVVVIEDLQWADAPSLGALRFALRRLDADGVLVVLTSTPEVWLTIGDPWRRLLDDHSRVRRRHLDGLDADDVIALATASGLGDLDRETAQRLCTHTGGHPLYVTALLSEVGLAGLRSASPVLPSPRSVSELTLDRLAALTTSAQRFVQAASVAGMTFTPVEIGRITGAPDTTVESTEVLTSGLVRAVGADGITFAHPLVRAAIYNGITLDERRALHRAAADATTGTVSLRHRVEARSSTDDVLADELEAAANAVVGDVVGAADLWLTAARVCDGGVRADCCVLRAVEMLVAGSHVARATTLRDRVEACRPSAWRELMLGQLDAFTGSFGAAAEHFAQALDFAEHRDPAVATVAGDVRARALVGAASVHWFAGDSEAALAKLDEALEGDVGWGASLASYLRAMAMLQLGRGEAALTETSRVALEPAEALAIRGALRFYRDDLSGAAIDLAEAVELGRQDSNGQLVPMAMALLAQVELRVGRWDAAAIHAELAVSFATDTGSLHALIEAMTAQVELAAGRGDLANADALLTEANALAELIPAWAGRTRVEIARAALAVARGDTAMLTLAADRLAGDRLRQPLSGFGVWRWLVVLADGELARGSLDEARAAVEELIAHVPDAADHPAWADITRLRALLLAASDRFDAAAQVFDSPAPGPDSSSDPHASGRLRVAHAAFLVDRGDPGAAALVLDRADALLAPLGAVTLLEESRRLRNAIGDHADAVEGVPPVDLDLTERQQTIAGLVAEGLTNKEIAATLFVSAKTVEYHLGQIFTRHDLRSRRELAALVKASRAGTGASRVLTR